MLSDWWPMVWQHVIWKGPTLIFFRYTMISSVAFLSHIRAHTSLVPWYFLTIFVTLLDLDRGYFSKIPWNVYPTSMEVSGWRGPSRELLVITAVYKAGTSVCALLIQGWCGEQREVNAWLAHKSSHSVLVNTGSHPFCDPKVTLCVLVGCEYWLLSYSVTNR